MDYPPYEADTVQVTYITYSINVTYIHSRTLDIEFLLPDCGMMVYVLANVHSLYE